MGVVRVGTLYDFRKEEHKRGISDPTEGKNQVYAPLKGTFRGEDLLPPVFDAFNIKILPNAKVTFKSSVAERRFDSDDAYVYCFSSVLSQPTMREMGDADSCFAIRDVSNFIQVLDRTLTSVTGARLVTVDSVTYQERRQEWNGKDWGPYGPLVKEPGFREQHEVRAVWASTMPGPISPLVVGSSELMRQCVRSSPPHRFGATQGA